MTVRQDIAGVINNALPFTFALAYNDKPLNLTGFTYTVVVKPSQTALDSAGTTYTVSSGLTPVSVVSGRFTLLIPANMTASAGTQWYRVDVSSGAGGPYTCMCGTLTLMSA